MTRNRKSNRMRGLIAAATLAVTLASVASVFLLAAPSATAAADDEEVAKKTEWQDRYRVLRNNAVRMRDNAIKLHRAYSLSQHSNYPRGGARVRFKQQVLDTEKKADDYEAQMASFLEEARQSQIPPGWIYEVDEEPIDPGSPAAVGEDEPTHRAGAPEGRNPAYVDGAREDYDDEAADEPADDRGESFGDFGDDRDDQYRIQDVEPNEMTADESKSDF
ncbi:MAG: hypothetical protein IPK00_02500 [Deltaproteobacteria bacterium]|nr:hypothetical protein [Deltaproteobacteria bacterium]